MLNEVIQVIGEVDKIFKEAQRKEQEKIEFNEDHDSWTKSITPAVLKKIFFVISVFLSIISSFLFAIELHTQNYLCMFVSCVFFILCLIAKLAYIHLLKKWNDRCLMATAVLDAINCLSSYSYSYWVKSVEFNHNINKY